MNSDRRQAMFAPIHMALQQLVIPQLLHHSSVEPADGALVILQSQRLAKACLSREVHAVETCVLNIFGQGSGLETLFLQTIPNAARLFHDWWAQEDIDFVAVTQASYRLQELVYYLSPEFVLSGPKSAAPANFRALLLNTPSSQHSLGLLILSEYFKRYGWQVLGGSNWREADMLTAVASSAIDVVGLSVSDERRFAYLKQLISSLRQSSLNKEVLVMVGGPLLIKHPQLAQWLGADFSSVHADQAQLMAMQQVEQVRVKQAKTSDLVVL
jgi:MerR family transcriptional regulator, light-induced transcriptional regulator